FCPFPATVVILLVCRSRRRMRWLSRSQKYSAPSGPNARPYGLFTCWSEKPGAPLPKTVDTDASPGAPRGADADAPSTVAASVMIASHRVVMPCLPGFLISLWHRPHRIGRRVYDA